MKLTNNFKTKFSSLLYNLLIENNSAFFTSRIYVGRFNDEKRSLIIDFLKTEISVLEEFDYGLLKFKLEDENFNKLIVLELGAEIDPPQFNIISEESSERFKESYVSLRLPIKYFKKSL